MISSPGVGSGLDVDTIVAQLMVLEQRPLIGLRQQQAGLEAEISAVGSLKSALAALQSAAAALGGANVYRNFEATSSDDKVLTASVGSTASAGTYSITVDALARRHRLASPALADANTEVGTGTLNIAVGISGFSLQIDATNNTLSGIRAAINAAADNPGVTASIVNVDAGSRLILTADAYGADNAISVTVSDDDGNDKDAGSGISRLAFDAGPPPVKNMTELDPAQDASLTVDTFTVTSATNSVAGVIDGVTLELEAEDSATLTVERSNAEALDKVQDFVSKYNAFRDTVAGLRAGVLNGDAVLRVVETSLRRAFIASSGVEGLDSALDLGLSFDAEGVLRIDTSTLLDAMDEEIDAVVDYFSAETTGFAERLDSLLEGYVGAAGVLDQRSDGLRASSDRLDLRAEALQARLVRVEQRIRNEFTGLDTLISSLQVTNNFLLQQLQSLPFTRREQR